MNKIYCGLLHSMFFCCTAIVYGQNVVFIMADDLGIGDISCYGSTMIETPHIDKMASQGIRFDYFYSAGSTCTPTRYSILTGRYPYRSNELSTAKWNGDFLINPDQMTIANIFKQRGYKTAAIGKWHLGYGNSEKLNYGEVLKPGPLELGFDNHWGVPQNHNDNVRGYVDNDRISGLDPNTPYKEAKEEDRV